MHLDAATLDDEDGRAARQRVDSCSTPATRSARRVQAQRRRLRRQPGPHVLDGHHLEHPAAGPVPAVQVRRGRSTSSTSRRPFDPPTGTYYMVAAVRRRGLAAPAQDDRPDRRDVGRGPEVQDLLRHRGRTTTTSSSRPTPWARTTGPRCPTSTGTRRDDARRRRATSTGTRCTAFLPTTRPTSTSAGPERRGLHVRGTTGTDRRVERRRPATPAASRTGRST